MSSAQPIPPNRPTRPSPPEPKPQQTATATPPQPPRRPCPPGQQGQPKPQQPNKPKSKQPIKQVQFTSPLPADPKVAIIGGGLSGLITAIELAARGIRSTVFDTGEHGVGGRLGTRASHDGSLTTSNITEGPEMVFDHAAQYFTASNAAFIDMVKRWQNDGAVMEWSSDAVGDLDNGTFTPHSDDSTSGTSSVNYVATGGMRSLAEYLAKAAVDTTLVDIQRPMWVERIQFNPSGWQVASKGQKLGSYDAVVIAHNGKCANRLSAPMGVPAVHSQLKRLKLSANWVLMIAFDQPVPVPNSSSNGGSNAAMEGAFIRNSDVLSWAANNTAKLQLPPSTTCKECWTLISTQTYGKANKVPQENIPADVAVKVTQEMLEAFSQALGLISTTTADANNTKQLPSTVFTKVQLWGAALPINSPNVPCIWDAVGRVGVTGDWVAGGGSMQNAALSGLAMAERIAGSRGMEVKKVGKEMSMGLTERLEGVGAGSSGSEQIGQFPS